MTGEPGQTVPAPARRRDWGAPLDFVYGTGRDAWALVLFGAILILRNPILSLALGEKVTGDDFFGLSATKVGYLALGVGLALPVSLLVLGVLYALIRGPVEDPRRTTENQAK